MEQIGLYEEAADLFLQTGSWPETEDLIQRIASPLIVQGKNKILEKWIGTIFDSGQNTSAVLLFWMGTSRLSSDPAGARTYLEKAFDAAADHDPVKLLSWSAIIDTYCLEWNDFRPLDRWIAWMEKTLGSGFVFRDKDIEARVVTTMSAALMLRQPHHPQIDIWTQRSMTLTRELADINFRIQKYLFLAFFYFWRGDLNRFRFILKEVGNFVSLPEATPLSRLALPCMESFIAIWLEGEYEKALEKINTALQYAETNGVLVWNHMLLSLKAYCFLAQGKVAWAEESLAAMTGQLDISRKHLYSQYFYLLAWCSYLKDDRGVARVQAATALEYAETTGYIFPRILCLIQNSWILYETGDSKKARVLLSRAKELSLRTNSSMMTYASALIEAGILLEEGQEEAGIATLKKAMILGRENGYITPPWWCQPPFMPGLCATALNHDIERDHVSSIVCGQRLVIDPPAEDPFLEWPWPVRVFTLGRFRLHSWGNPVVFSRKAQKKPLEMLKVLIAMGGSEIGREKITDILWPDADGDMANKSFATTLHRLRQLLGEKQAIRLNEGRVSLDSRYCWVDALFFLKRAAEIDQHWRKSPDSQMLGNTRDVIDLYQGNFLEGHPEEKWIDTFRVKLQQKCLKLLERIGKYREQRGEFDQAILYYEKAIEIDPLAESFYLFLMECYYHLGWPGQIVRTYNLCREQLRDSIDIEPSLRLKNTYNAMLSGQY
ncbi:MAG: hypothetical protein KGY38_04360 [Desulfobacterales bacterium]|nr:hypothetical protein [Desulfobacterales bacterium]